MHRAARRIVILWTLASWAATGWVLSLNPFAAPVIERTADEARLAFSRAMTLRVTPEWLLPRLEAAVVADAPDDVALYLELAAENGVTLPDGLAARAEEALAAHERFFAASADCAACAWDIGACPTLTMIGICAIPVEMTPVGDLNALRRAAADWIAGEEVDRLDAGLAVFGLAATAGVAISGGTSVTAKVGATVLRLGRRLGAISPRLMGTVADALTGLVRWDRLDDVILGRMPAGEAVDGARGGRFMSLAADIKRLSDNTSPAEALMLLHHADTAEDLARLARVSGVAGTDTRKVMRVLGSDAFRLLHRVSHLAELAIGLVALLATQLAALALALPGMLLRRLAGRARRRLA
ncbi:MAG: hypothetical protein F9K34_14775 [Albidovulum sp.]|uniref:hypothetical protein n=1 Tax=Albidovulum sp. TaxID=1872424 RepID=UPI001322BC02|nr:hypothetical protein [Defluviimonas sp.]KAB2882320.1 MAG: hypothetical protein F9K34_14775 [Defluviimonas sp.]